MSFRSTICQWVALLLVPLALGAGFPNSPSPEKQEAVMNKPEPSRLAATAAKAAMPPLTAAEQTVIQNKGTELAFSGAYWNHFEPGTYVCRQCGAALYRSSRKFRSECGWPSFDDEIAGAVKRQADADGERMEILCAKCGGHLGHLFLGEGFTPTGARHCVNSVSLVFRPDPRIEQAIFAGGCFWGVEHWFEAVKGVRHVTSGYTGGTVKNPTYQQVCSGRTGHAEAVRIEFDPTQVSYEELARLFFEIHDPTELNFQGPDVGPQYRSAIFYFSDQQKQTAEKLIADLKARHYPVVTELARASIFYPAEAYHQKYLDQHPGRTCQPRVERFGKTKPKPLAP
jgi:peptide methionine sulfoxide reductase msrA/msrB